MSILAFVVDPQSDEERSFSVPVASEVTFKERWQPIVEALEFHWLPLFSTGVEIRDEDAAVVLDELVQFRIAYIKRFGADGVVERVDLLLEGIKRLFSFRRGVVVYVG